LTNRPIFVKNKRIFRPFWAIFNTLIMTQNSKTQQNQNAEITHQRSQDIRGNLQNLKNQPGKKIPLAKPNSRSFNTAKLQKEPEFSQPNPVRYHESKTNPFSLNMDMHKPVTNNTSKNIKKTQEPKKDKAQNYDLLAYLASTHGTQTVEEYTHNQNHQQSRRLDHSL